MTNKCKRFFFFLITTISFLFPCSSFAETRLSAYFSNDSVNGLFVSDAYETHNMGIIYEFSEKYLSLDLGIVSPDMHVYKNQFREPNRSFGELVTLSYGFGKRISEKFSHEHFAQVRSTGKFGIDEMQDFMHKMLGLQQVNSVNDLVRMPNNTWYGVGGKIRKNLGNKSGFVNDVGANYYLGTDRAELSPFISTNFASKNLIFSTDFGLRTIFYDKIVSAPPIYADHRTLIPYIELGVDFKYLGAEWFVKDRLSLPTINGDDTIFGVLSAGIIFDVN